MENNVSLIERYVTAQLAPLKKQLRRIEAQQQLEVLGIEEHVKEISERLARIEHEWRTVKLIILTASITLILIFLFD